MDIYQKAEEQIVEKQRIVDFDIKEFTIELLISKYLTGKESDDNDIFIPTYQRNFVWDVDRQSKFIESVLLGLPIPYIFSADTEGRLEIVDGSQRLRTLVAFNSNELTLRNLDILVSLNGFKYKDLIKSRQRKFLNSTIRMIALSDKSDEDVRFLMFERINTGSALLKDMEKRKGIFGGKFMDFVYNDCSKHPLFIRNTRFTENLEKRGEPQELIIRFFAYSENYKEVRSGVNEFLNNFVEEKNKSFNKNILYKEYDNMLKFVDKHFPGGFIKSANSKKTPRVRFDALAVGVNLALRDNPLLEITDTDWINSKTFNELITKGGQNAPSAIKERIEFVYNKLIKNK
ncbi:DUF262 domain-containing protein [Telluribacter sp. SYSU D00476]|uniref:DUF262 domain-containing protein n=1 Tax=Telluribacter sp. SYSU D00476 TaxID=2811430 RepID=UPI001FF4DD37|nr:DUF262 domain-containing protein [Telluribacter sp. SYSU D00476]